MATKKDTKPRQRKAAEPVYDMPIEVRDWIEQANSRMRHMQSKIDRLEEENRQLRSYKQFAEHRILRSEHE